MTINDFFLCNSGRVLWCVENGSHKQTGCKVGVGGKLERRSGYPVLLEGLLEDSRKWYGILAGGRKKEWSTGYEQNGMPECGIRLFLYPRHTAEPHQPSYWKFNGGIPGPSGNVVGPVVKSMTMGFDEDDDSLLAEERRTRFPPGGSWTNGSFRYGCNHMMARKKVPEALRAIFCGHAIVFAKFGGKRPDSNAGHYGRDLLAKIEELLRVRLVLEPVELDHPVEQLDLVCLLGLCVLTLLALFFVLAGGARDGALRRRLLRRPATARAAQCRPPQHPPRHQRTGRGL